MRILLPHHPPYPPFKKVEPKDKLCFDHRYCIILAPPFLKGGKRWIKGGKQYKDFVFY